MRFSQRGHREPRDRTFQDFWGMFRKGATGVLVAQKRAVVCCSKDPGGPFQKGAPARLYIALAEAPPGGVGSEKEKGEGALRDPGFPGFHDDD